MIRNSRTSEQNHQNIHAKESILAQNAASYHIAVLKDELLHSYFLRICQVFQSTF